MMRARAAVDTVRGEHCPNIAHAPCQRDACHASQADAGVDTFRFREHCLSVARFSGVRASPLLLQAAASDGIAFGAGPYRRLVHGNLMIDGAPCELQQVCKLQPRGIMVWGFGT